MLMIWGLRACFLNPFLPTCAGRRKELESVGMGAFLMGGG